MLTLGSMLVAVCAVSGCGASADSLMQSEIQTLNSLAEAYETKAPEAKISELKKQQEENNQKFAELKLSDDETKKLKDRYKDELVKALAKYTSALVKTGDFGKISQAAGLPIYPIALMQELVLGQAGPAVQVNAGAQGAAPAQQRIGFGGGRRK